MGKKQLINLLSKFEENPVIAAVKNKEELLESLVSDANVVFVLFGNIMDISTNIKSIKEAKKTAIVHIDLLDGISSKDTVAVDFIKQNTMADGIISTRPQLIKRAKELELLAIQRFFIIDSIAFKNVGKQMEQSPADAIEILPGTMPKIIKKLLVTCKKPIIAGGLICDKEDVVSALGAGAAAVSSTNKEVWFL